MTVDYRLNPMDYPGSLLGFPQMFFVHALVDDTVVSGSSSDILDTPFNKGQGSVIDAMGSIWYNGTFEQGSLRNTIFLPLLNNFIVLFRSIEFKFNIWRKKYH